MLGGATNNGSRWAFPAYPHSNSVVQLHPYNPLYYSVPAQPNSEGLAVDCS